jgi:dolichyl-phosphate-mannose--protein O-mannosyl transferase
MSKVSDRFALSILAFLLVFAICQLGFNALTLDTWMDEGKYLMKGYWYVTGKVPPYSEIDPTYYMPFAFYADGLVQWLFGIGYLPGRILMILFSVACLVLVYLVGVSLGRSRLAGVGAIGFSILVV